LKVGVWCDEGNREGRWRWREGDLWVSVGERNI